jgi:hypothetical protein
LKVLLEAEEAAELPALQERALQELAEAVQADMAALLRLMLDILPPLLEQLALAAPLGMVLLEPTEAAEETPPLRLME